MYPDSVSPQIPDIADRVSFLLFITITLSIYISESSPATIITQYTSCTCHHGYTAIRHPKDNKMYCHGILHEGKTPCVNLERPRCKCTLGQGFMVQDLYGYWCIKVKPGFVEEIRWDCENKRDWDEFFKMYPEEKPVGDSEL